MIATIRTLASALVLFGLGSSAQAQEEVKFALNWVAGGDHAPYYYAQAEGWYKDAGIDLVIEQGKGSAAAAQKVGAGVNPLGLADLATALIARGKGADIVGIYNVYANSPQGLYWLKSSGISGIKDFPGKKIGNPAGDAARAMWPALAKAQDIDPDSVTWVNIAPNAKLGALKAKSIDITTSFYNIHHIFQRELGDDMGFVAWRDVGLNPYGNTIIANADYLESHKDTVAAFVQVTQKAFATCVATPEPCIDALVAANSALKKDNELQNWKLVTELMSDEISRTVALGWLDDDRMVSDYVLVETYLGLDQPFDIKTAYSNEFIDQSIKMSQ